MIKKSLFALFTTLIAGGVLLVGSTDAFKYTAQGPSVIAFENGKLSSLIDSIKYGIGDSMNTLPLSLGNDSPCTEKDYGDECTITPSYDDVYNVVVTFKNKASEQINNIRLNNEINNIKSIENLDGISIEKIITLDLSNNTGIDLNNKASSKIEQIKVNTSELNEFKLKLDNKDFKTIEFKNNKLSSLSGEIRCNRDKYIIYLTDDITIGNGGYNNSYKIKLQGNEINFVGLTKYYYTERGNRGSRMYEKDIECDSYNNYNNITFKNETGYTFERFGYQEQDGTDLTYIYTLTGSNGFSTGWSVVDGTGVTIPAEYLPFSGDYTYYTFKVCIQENTDICDSIDFLVKNDNLKLEFIENETNIESGGTANSLTDVTFARRHTSFSEYAYKYPEDQIYGYEYKLYKNNSQLIANSTVEKTCNYGGENCHGTKNIGQALTDEGIFDTYKDLTGDFKFEVYILDNDNHSYIYGDDNEPIRTTRYFHIIEPEQPDTPTITITRPNSTDPETGVDTNFNWTHTLDTEHFIFDNYYWTISGVENNILLTGIINNENTEYFSTGVLSNGDYVFNVILNYTIKNGGTGEAHDIVHINGIQFSVEKSRPSIHIDRPLDTEEGDITYFSWTPNITPGFECNNYEWFISENDVPIITGRNLCSNTGYQTGGLNNGTYKFNVKLNYTQTSNGETGYAVDSRYASYGGSMTFEVNKTNSIRITNPSNGSTGSSANVTFTWEKNLSDTFSGYEIILTGGNNNINTREIIKTESTTTRTVNDLRDGSYRFKVIMHYTDSSNNPQTREDDITFYIDASAGIHINITKPSSGSNFITGGAREIPIEFEWNGGGSTLISGYSYTIKKGSTTIEQGTRGKNESGIYTLGSKDLSGGTYTFTVTMLAKNGAQMIDESSTFTVVILSDLNILSPQDGDIFVGKQDVQFSRSGFAEFSHYKYSYTLEKTKKGTKTTIKSGNNLSLNDTGFTQFLENGNYEFTVRMMDGSSEIKKKTHRFEVLDITGLVLTISDGSSSWNSDTNRIEIKTGTILFNYGGKSEDFSGYYYSITGTNFKGETFIYTGKNFGELTGSLTLTGLLSGKYRFVVRMLDDSNSDILTEKLDFNITIPSKLTITNPTNGSSVTSSSTTFSRVGESDILRTGYTNDKRHYEYELLQVIASGYEQKAASPKTNANSFSYTALQDGATYQLNVKLYSGSNTLLASDTSTFSISIPRPSGGGGGGGSSSKSHPTNDLTVNITNDEPTTDERVEVVVDVNEKYTGKVDFTKMQYYSFDEEKWIDIPVTSDHYVSDSSDDAKLGYVKFTSDDDGEKELSEFLKFSQPGNYRLYAEDKDGYREYVEFYIGKGSAPAKVDEEDYYIARSCKKYKIEYYDKLGVYSSPNLIRDEFFVSRDYFYRYIDSKNKQIDGCPTNYGWINTTYNDTSNSSQRYTAPNGKVYFISNENGTYSSSELNKELNGAKRFSSINELKYFIRDRNPFINMYAPVK